MWVLNNKIKEIIEELREYSKYFKEELSKFKENLKEDTQIFLFYIKFCIALQKIKRKKKGITGNGTELFLDLLTIFEKIPQYYEFYCKKGLFNLKINQIQDFLIKIIEVIKRN